MSPRSKTVREIPYKWIALSVAAIGSDMATLDGGVIRISLPALAEVFQTSANTIAWVWLVYLLIGSSLMLIMGRVSDAIGRKKLFTYGLFIYGSAMGLCSLSQNLTQLIVFRMIQAVGNSMVIATGNAIITGAFPSGERGKAIGIVTTLSGIGVLAGPMLGGVLLDAWGWRSIFYVRAPIVLVSGLIAWMLLREAAPPKSTGKFDVLGAITLFLTLASLLLAVNRGQDLGWASPLVVGVGLVCLVSLALFIFTEMRVAQPVLDMRLFQDRLFSSAIVSHIFLHMTDTAVGFLMPFYLIQGLGLSAAYAGTLMVTIAATRMLVSPLAGRLSDRWKTLSLCASGLAVVLVGVLLLRRLEAETSISLVVVYLFVIGFGTGLFLSPNTSAIMGSVSGERLGTASAMVGTVRQIGMSIGVAITAGSFAASQTSYVTQLTSRGLAEDMVNKLSVIGGFHDALLATLVFTAIAFVASLLRGRK